MTVAGLMAEIPVKPTFFYPMPMKSWEASLIGYVVPPLLPSPTYMYQDLVGLHMVSASLSFLLNRPRI